MSSDACPASLLPRSGQSRAWWRAPASASALAWTIARVARTHAGPLLAVMRDNHAAHQLEQDLRTFVGDDAATRAWHAAKTLRFARTRSPT